MLDPYVRLARDNGASDIHLEPGMPVALRIRGELCQIGEPVPGETTMALARHVVGRNDWSDFLARRSFDGSRIAAGAHCRLHVMATSRGVGLAIRLLAGFQPTVDNLNLHPDLRRLVEPAHGLVVICGPTGSGKTTTLAALIQEVNLGPARNIVTLESPIEYPLRPRKAFIRQREVGRDTPSFEQGLLDAMREDPDVLMVGEIRRRETMQLTLDAAETGHLVVTTMHSSAPGEALQRLASAFPPETQASVRAQLADTLVAVLAQRLLYRPDAGIRVPECELLMATPAVRNQVREGRFFKLQAAMETGASDGMWTFERYRRWLDGRRQWRLPELDGGVAADVPAGGSPLPKASAGTSSVDLEPVTSYRAPAAPSSPAIPSVPVAADPQAPASGAEGVIVIDDGDVGDLDQLMAELEDS